MYQSCERQASKNYHISVISVEHINPNYFEKYDVHNQSLLFCLLPNSSRLQVRSQPLTSVSALGISISLASWPSFHCCRLHAGIPADKEPLVWCPWHLVANLDCFGGGWGEGWNACPWPEAPSTGLKIFAVYFTSVNCFFQLYFLQKQTATLSARAWTCKCSFIMKHNTEKSPTY